MISTSVSGMTHSVHPLTHTWNAQARSSGLVRAGMDSNSMKMSKLADKVEVSGQTLSAADLRELMENSTSVQ